MRGTAGRVRVAPPERDPRGCGQRCFKELGRQQSCIARSAGSTTWTSAGSPAEAGPSCRSCNASPQRRRVFTVPSLIETICELYMTRINREAWVSLSVPCAHTVRACVNMCDANLAAFLRAQNNCVYATTHLIQSQHDPNSQSVVPSTVSPRLDLCLEFRSITTVHSHP